MERKIRKERKERLVESESAMYYQDLIPNKVRTVLKWWCSSIIHMSALIARCMAENLHPKEICSMLPVNRI